MIDNEVMQRGSRVVWSVGLAGLQISREKRAWSLVLGKGCGYVDSLQHSCCGGSSGVVRGPRCPSARKVVSRGLLSYPQINLAANSLSPKTIYANLDKATPISNQSQEY